MEYFETRDRPPGNGLCSDNDCPCPETVIPHGGGYLYISQSVVDFRRDARSIEALQRKLERMASGANSYFGNSFYLFDQGMANPILMCELGAKLRGLDLQVAGADAAYWWQTGLVPLRATPLAKK